MTLFAASDLHLGLSAVAHMFNDARQGRTLADLCDRVLKARDGELLLPGDIFDLTALRPPEHGLEAFASTVQVPIEPPKPRELPQLMAALRNANPIGLGALEKLAARAPVTLIPGNHDRHLGEPGGREALDAAGLKNVRIEPQSVRQIEGRTIVFQHGHAWDPSNATPAGGGEVMTSVLHNAVVPYLRHLAPRSNVKIDADRIVALRPEERVVPVLERWLRPGQFETFLDAFLELLVANGYLSRMVSWLATPERIRQRLKADDDLWEKAGHTAFAALEGREAIPGRPPPPDIFVLGHTHMLDWAVHEGRPGAQRLYVNLGTWTERAMDAAGPLDATLPLLEITGASGQLTATLSDIAAQRELQRFETH